MSRVALHRRPNDHARRVRSLLARAACALLIAALMPVVTGAPTAQAVVTQPFTPPVYTTNTNGDILIRGNTLLACLATQTGCTNAQNGTGSNLNNNDYDMRFVDTDTVGSTLSSSSTDLTLPPSATVLFAGLYWSAYTSGGTTRPPATTAKNQLKLRAPGDTAYRTITASRVDDGPAGTASYQGFADVTSVVAGAGSGSYSAADIFAAQGADRYGSWSLVVAVSAPSLPVRNLTIFNGFGTVRSADPNLDIPVAGFQTPPAGPVRTKLGAVIYEGDVGLVGDSFSLVRANNTSVPVTDANNPATNPFNSSISDSGTRVTTRTPSFPNSMGLDADTFTSTGLLGNNASSATLRLSTVGDTYFPGVITFAVDLFSPSLVAHKTAAVVDVDGDRLTGVGDRIDYTLDVTNNGLDDSVNTVLTDAVPLGTTYFPNSLRVGGAAVTDAGDADRGEVAGGQVTTRLGTGAGGVGGAGGRLGVDATARVQFTVTIGADNPDGATIVNVANLAYRGAQTNLALTGTSDITKTPFTAPRADLVLTKVADPVLVQRSGDRTVTYTLAVVNQGPKVEPNAVLVDDLPPGFTLVSVTGPGCTTAAGRLTCRLGRLGVGATASVLVTGRLPANAPASSPNTASVTGDAVDPDPASNTATATVAVNTAPVAQNDTASVDPGDSVAIPVLGNDSDADGDPLTITTAIVLPPEHGTVDVVAGQLVYTPTDPAFKGTDTLEYQVCDGRGGCATATVAVTVGNAAPTAVDDTTGTTPNTPVTIDVLGNDTDPNGDRLHVDSVTQPPVATGSVTIVDGSPVFTPAPGFRGPATFTYTVCDNNTPVAGCDTATVIVLVDDAAPVAVDDSLTTPFQTPLTIDPATLLANDTDPNDDPLTVTAVSNPSHGTVTRDPVTGTVVFTPDAGFVGTASFDYRVCDDATPQACDTGTVHVTVPNTPPVARDDAATTAPASPVTIDVKANDSDAETPTADLTVTLTGLPTDAAGNPTGSALVDAAGQVTFTPTSGFKGAATIPYRLCDPQGACDDATITVTVENAAPVAVDDERPTTVNQPVRIPVLGNDTDPNGDTLHVDAITVQPAHGTVVVNADGTVTYTPAPDFVGTDTFDYRVCDDDRSQRCDTATVTVTTANRPPVGVPDQASGLHTAGAATVLRADVLANDTDADGQPLHIGDVTQPPTGSGSVEVVDGKLVYTAPPDFIGTVAVTYEVIDASGALGRTTATFVVGNTSPVAVDDVATTSINAPVTIDLTGNDTDADHDVVTVQEITAPPTHGSVTIDADGRVTYTPDHGFTGDDTFGYTVCDPYAACTTAVAHVTVTNTAPVAGDDSATVPAGSSVVIGVGVNDSDADPADHLTAPVITRAPTTGTATVNADGTITFTAAADTPDGTVVTFDYQVCDDAEVCDTATVTVTITNPPTETSPPTTPAPTTPAPTTPAPTTPAPTNPVPTAPTPTPTGTIRPDTTGSSPSPSSSDGTTVHGDQSGPGSGSDGGSDSSSQDSGLPGTGAEVGGTALAGIVLLGAGIVAVVIGRRRRTG